MEVNTPFKVRFFPRRQRRALSLASSLILSSEFSFIFALKNTLISTASVSKEEKDTYLLSSTNRTETKTRKHSQGEERWREPSEATLDTKRVRWQDVCRAGRGQKSDIPHQGGGILPPSLGWNSRVAMVTGRMKWYKRGGSNATENMPGSQPGALKRLRL